MISSPFGSEDHPSASDHQDIPRCLWHQRAETCPVASEHMCRVCGTHPLALQACRAGASWALRDAGSVGVPRGGPELPQTEGERRALCPVALPVDVSDTLLPGHRAGWPSFPSWALVSRVSLSDEGKQGLHPKIRDADYLKLLFFF